jgi:hypothetical protein
MKQFLLSILVAASAAACQTVIDGHKIGDEIGCEPWCAEIDKALDARFLGTVASYSLHVELFDRLVASGALGQHVGVAVAVLDDGSARAMSVQCRRDHGCDLWP